MENDDIEALSPNDIGTDNNPNTDDIRENTEGDGVTAHTFHRVRGAPTTKCVAGLKPDEIKRYYRFNSCHQGKGVIAIVSAFNYPTALADFNVFSKKFRLPTETSTNPLAAANKVFQIINARGVTPETNAGWAMESALDIEWAHALAPRAKIVLVQAASNKYVDLFQAVDVANAIPNVVSVAMSWGGFEWSEELEFDAHLKQPGVIYVAGAGDIGGMPLYPSVSQYVVSAGGTKLNLGIFGILRSETAWSDGGGGPSLFVPIPSYQAAHPGVAAKVGSSRGTPDVSFDADPASGVAVYDSTPYNGVSGWFVLGGTSYAAPAWAAVSALICEGRGQFTSTPDFLTTLYNLAGKIDYTEPQLLFRDIVEGQSGIFSATRGWDYCTGLGSPIESLLACPWLKG